VSLDLIKSNLRNHGKMTARFRENLAMLIIMAMLWLLIIISSG
jgi:hypothetical protein